MLHHHRREPDPASPDAVDREIGLVIREAAARVRTVEELVQRCKDDTCPGSELARDGGRIMIDYAHLRQRLERLPQTPRVQHVAELLNFEQTLLHQALLYAFRPESPDKWRLLADLGGGRGAPSEDLERLAAESGPC